MTTQMTTQTPTQTQQKTMPRRTRGPARGPYAHQGLHTPYLREWREHFVLSAVELAQLAGISRQAWSSYETGYARASFARIRRIAELLGISPDQLVRQRPPSAEDMPRGAA